jgi:signal transduction histidine kinase
MTPLTAQEYPAAIAARIAAERLTLASLWLARLRTVLTVSANEVFPSEQLLDHIPSLVEEIAAYVAAPEEEEIAANAAVMHKARELGQLRHGQHASVHQLLHEYEILGEILESFLAEETDRLGLKPTVADGFEVHRRLTRAVRVLMRTTVDTFVAEYTSTIQEQNERLKAFNRAASHELRTPIGTLRFAAALLERDAVREEPARLARVTATIKTSTDRLAWLIENLQRIARMQDPLDVPSEQQVDLAALAEGVASQLADMADARHVAIRIAPDLPAIVADPARLELILLNLVGNAIKYSDPSKSEPFVEIAEARRAVDAVKADEAQVTLCVRDNGLGIAEADQPAIFDRFFRAHAHRDQELGVTGTGLGLAIVIDCVQALGGAIRCESRGGEGTEFYITLPRTATPSAQSV